MNKCFIGGRGEIITLIGSADESTTTVIIDEARFATARGDINENEQKLLSHGCKEESA
jgi:hypothetical protein